MSFLNNILFEKQKKGENTDCTFVFQIPPEDGNLAKEILVHGHKLVLGAVSPYFESNFKTEWEKNQPIQIKTVDYDVFIRLLHVVYLNEITLEALDEGLILYEVAHFYPMIHVLELLRGTMAKHWFANKTMQIARFLNTAYAVEDWILLQFFAKIFHSNISRILSDSQGEPDPDWFNYHPDVVNYLFSSYNVCSAISDASLKAALEKFVTHHKGSFSMETFKLTLEAKKLNANVNSQAFLIEDGQMRRRNGFGYN